MMKFLLLFSLFSLCFADSLEDYLRNYYMPFAAAAYSNNPNLCLSNIQKWDDGASNNPYETVSVYRRYNIKCGSLYDMCSGYTAVVDANQDGTYGPIIVVFKGTTSFLDFFATGWNYNQMVPFVGGGKVSKQFLDAFNNIWINAGMKNDILTLKNKYPYSLFIFIGHSTGGAMASLAAVTATATGLSDFVGLYTFGQPRTGDINFANLITPQNFWHSYRIIHNADAVPHLPSLNESTYYHYASEWWYPNDMGNGDSSIQCSPDNGEDPTCSNSLDDSVLTLDDHKTYYGRKFVEYGVNGCQDLVPSLPSVVKGNEKRTKASDLKPLPDSSLFISPFGIVYTKEAKNNL